MEENSNTPNKSSNSKKSFAKLWPVWLIAIVIIALALINAKKGNCLLSCPFRPAENDQSQPQLSGRVLSLVHQDQFFFPNRFGTKMADFSVKTLDGKNITLSSLSGRQVMIVCWATWCPPCREEIPYIARLREQIDTNKLEIIGLSFENPDVVRNFVENSDINYTVATASAEDMPEPLSRVTALPTIIFLDQRGNIKVAVQGGLSFNQMKAIVQAD